MIKFLKINQEINGLRIVGSDIKELTEEALKHIWRYKDYHKNKIPDELLLLGYSTISHHDTYAPNGTITIIHDKLNFFTNADLDLSGMDFYKKIKEYRIYRNNIED